MTEQVVAKLEEALKMGAPRTEACLWAKIDRSTLHRHMEADPTFATQIEEWENDLVMAARRNVADAIRRKKNVHDSWAYLRAKRKVEFSENSADEEEQAITCEELEAMSNLGIVVKNRQDAIRRGIL